MKILGVDLGVHGGLAIVATETGPNQYHGCES
jgi:hypothetical protein